MASIIVIAAVLVLDVLAFVLAIGAERRRSYVNYVSVDPAGGVLLRVQLRRVHGVRRERAAAAARRAGRGHGRHPLLLLRPRALAGPLAGVVRHLLHRLLGDVRDRGAVPAGRVGPERVSHQVLPQGRRPAAVRHAAQGRLRRRRRLHLPRRALRRAALPLLRQGARRRRRRGPAHRRRHRHDPHVMSGRYCPVRVIVLYY
ncbi:fiber protein Fb34 [Zea mays]|uniref:fiber protein Fb34 n=1 Tax=Zea mays TaxID=4577 RepID=UPI000F0AB8CC|nr:fiber protein Fb34 [Zea mays]